MKYLFLVLLGGWLAWAPLLAGHSTENGLVLEGTDWYLLENGALQGPVLPNRIVIRRTDNGPVTLQAIQSRGGQAVTSTTLIVAPYYVVTLSNNETFGLFTALREDPSYSLVDYDRVGHFTGSSTESLGTPCVDNSNGRPNDGQYGNQEAYFQLHHIPDAWELTRGDPSVVVAVVDSGIDTGHSDFAKNIFVNPGEDANHNGIANFTPSPSGDINQIDEDANGFKDDLIGWDFRCNDNHPDRVKIPHGTSVASILGAMTNNCEGISGVAGGWGMGYTPTSEGTYSPGVSVMPVRVNDEHLDVAITTVIQSISYAASTGAHIVNVCIEWNSDLPWVRAMIQEILTDHEIVLCVAGGDTGSTITYPGAYPGVLTVGPAKIDGTPVFTSYPKGLEMDVIACHTVTADTTSKALECGTLSSVHSEETTQFSGTSASAPLVSGTAGLMLSVNPYLTREDVLFILRATAMKIGMQGNYFTCASGYGTLNAYAAVYEAAAQEIPPVLNLSNSVSSGFVGLAYDLIATQNGFRVASGREAVLHAGQEIVLGPGTVIANGSVFRADVGYHETCPTLILSSD